MQPHTITRRSVLAAGLCSAACGYVGGRATARAIEAPVVNDVTNLNPVQVSRIATPRSGGEIADLIREWPGVISVGGGRYSMGGQIAAADSLHLDLRGMNRAVWFDPAGRRVRVQTGMRWRDLLDLIDPYDLSVKIMQSYSDFTVGGALSVNGHGRYVGLGPVINSVNRIQLVVPDGRLLEASPLENPELYFGAIGGYGGIGVITEAELEVAPNIKMERSVRRIPLSEYPAFFAASISANPDAIMHNADIDPAEGSEIVSLTWSATDKPVSIDERLISRNEQYRAGALEIWALAKMPAAHLLRRELIEPLIDGGNPVVRRNHEASISVASLGALAGDRYCYALQEYFVPTPKFAVFAAEMLRILQINNVNALNVSVRHSPADPGSMLQWAREPVFSFVLFYRQNASSSAQQQVGVWTRQLIDAALASGGTYYLPYQLHATEAQFELAYPDAAHFFALKSEVDPHDRLRNKLWEKYYHARV